MAKHVKEKKDKDWYPNICNEFLFLFSQELRYDYILQFNFSVLPL